MKGEVVAEVQRVLRGDSERALVHAVDNDGLEYRVEVPNRAVREVEDGRGYRLRLSWSLEASTVVADAQHPSSGQLAEAPPATSQASTATQLRSPAEVDAAFMALMKGLEGRTGTARTDAARPSEALQSAAPVAIPDSAMQLASRLGLTSPESTTDPQALE